MIDIHSHILPGLDDGAATVEKSIAMVGIAAAGGTTDIIATPHRNLQYAFDPRAVETAVYQLQQQVGNMVRIHYGCELHITPEGIEDACRWPAQYALAHGPYLLVEFSDQQVPRNASDILSFLLSRGLRPVIAHPERNPLLRARITELEGWVRHGCAIQLTAQSVLGRFGKAALVASREFLTRGLAHVVATDSHDSTHRPPDLKTASSQIQESYGSVVADALTLENPRAVLEGYALARVGCAVRRRAWFSSLFTRAAAPM